MGASNGPCSPDYPEGSNVRIFSRAEHEVFRENWKLHNRLTADQLNYAGRRAVVKAVGYYHGGDEQLYELVDVPGVWHEACLARDG